MDRRTLLKSAALAGGLSTLNGFTFGPTYPRACSWRQRQGEDLKPLSPIKSNIFARGTRGMASSSHPLATEAATCALEKGGSAADAYLTAAFAQTVLEPVMTTLAGGLGMGYFDAKSGQFYQCGGGFASPAAERADWSDAESITARPTLVPGYVRGAELIHKRFGKLSWAELLEPAIAFAEDGFIIDHQLWGATYEKRTFAGRFPSGRAIWFPNGHLLGVGERMRQPELAKTLKRLRDEGPDYFYTGEWAKRFVTTLREQSSKMTLEDLANFKASISPGWTPGSGEGTATTTYRGYEVGPPAHAMFGLACNLFEVADLKSRGRPTESGDSLYYLMRIMQEMWHTGLMYNPGDHDVFLSKDYARQIWRVIESGPPRPFAGLFEGTCALTMVDAEGNVAAGTHSSTSPAYGSGIFVDGVIANRILYFRNGKFPGGVGTNVWLFKDGKPTHAMASPSRAFNEALLQNLANVVEYGMDLGTSVSQPRFGHPDPQVGATQIESDFSPDVIKHIRKRGMNVIEVSPLYEVMGSCHAVQLNGGNGEIYGAADPRRRGMAKGV